ncbi:hypothetical protein [Nitrosomonas sp. Nm58]|uniref:hypothetical protein n=1 Tax=Nitrosomonas sp. Nm58 TaxID=200126 RepID=UPI00089442A6|nr:hypothetical protein [Nitrosomonas sp. Nm58]SDZ14189.1 hypothetical protein SAMN05421754_10723 [Nitrosomonas sp. Nm58]
MMQGNFSIQIQKLFLITIILKIGFSLAGFLQDDPWVLGFTIPLLIMAAYIAIGIKYRNNDVPDDKFADSCYYLGFIFTITSIIVCLFDLPNIGTEINNISIRFGAAMVSTVFGLIVRVYLVSFKRDASDAIEDAEVAVIEASNKFREQLVIAFEKMCDFQSEADKAIKASVERANLQIEALSKNHADKLISFFSDLTEQNRKTLTDALSEIKTSSVRLSESVDKYSNGMAWNLNNIQSRIDDFTQAVSSRLSTTTFPDDYFAKSLANPLAQLNNSVNAISLGVAKSASEVDEAGKILSSTLKTIRTKAISTETSLDKVVTLANQQKSILEVAQGQVSIYTELSDLLKKIDQTLIQITSAINASTHSSNFLASRVDSIVSTEAKVS